MGASQLGASSSRYCGGMNYYVTNALTARRWSRAQGFSLIELLMVVSVASILLAIAVPSFRSFVQNTRLTTQANTLVYALNLALAAAVKLDIPVEVCASTDATDCNGVAWSGGWIVCYPVASCAVGGGPPAGTVLSVSPQLGNANTANEKVAGALAVSYLANGQTNNGVGGTTYQFVFCDARGVASGQDVEINFTGRIQASQTAGKQINGLALPGC